MLIPALGSVAVFILILLIMLEARLMGGSGRCAEIRNRRLMRR